MKVSKSERTNDTTPEGALSAALSSTRLGTCYDGFSRKILHKQNAFNLAKLNEKRLLVFPKGRGVFELTANSSSNATSNSTNYRA